MSDQGGRINQLFTEIESLSASDKLAEARQKLDIFFSEETPILARAHNDAGVIAYRQGDKNDALQHYTKAVEMAPESPIFRKNLADLCYFEFGNAETALAHYRQILVDTPLDFDANIAIGRICADMGRHFLAEAEDFFNLAKRIRPEDVQLSEELNKLNSNNTESATEKIVTDHTSGQSSLSNAEQEYKLIESYLTPGREQEAEENLLLFLDKFPGFALAHNDLGVISHKLEKFENAGSCYREAVRLAPDNMTFRKNLADFIFIIENQPETAMVHYNEVLKTNPKDVETLMMIGSICLSLGSKDEARNFFNLVLSIEPWNIDADQAIENLNESEST